MTNNRYFFIFLSTFFFYLSLPPFNIFISGYVFLVPIFIYILRIKPNYKQIIYIGTIVSITQSMWLFGGLFKYYGILIYLVSIIYFSIWQIILFLLTGLFANKKLSIIKIFFISSFYLISEYIKTLGSFAFPVSFSVIQPALFNFYSGGIRIFGFYWISFCIIFINLIVTKLILEYNSKSRRITNFSIMLIFFILNIIFNFSENVIKNEKTLNLSIVQGSVPPITFLRDKEKVFFEYLSLINQINNKNNFIIIPEGFIKLNMNYYKLNFLKEYCKKNNSLMLYNDINYDLEANKYNSSFLINETGKIKPVYHKSRTVPFTENMYTASKISEPVNLEKYKFGVNICYEVLFSNVSIEETKKGALFLLTQANDSGITGNIISELHKRYAILRAIENGRYMFFSSQSGPSAVISPTGKILDELSIYQKGIINKKIKLYKIETLYSTYPYSFICLILVSFFLFLLEIMLYKKYLLKMLKK